MFTSHRQPARFQAPLESTLFSAMKPRNVMQRDLSGAENLKFPSPTRNWPHAGEVVSLAIHLTRNVNRRILAF